MFFINNFIGIMDKYESKVNQIWEELPFLSTDSQKKEIAVGVLSEIIGMLDKGTIRVCKKIDDGQYALNQWIKKAIVLYLNLSGYKVFRDGHASWYDKVRPKFQSDISEAELQAIGSRLVPGSYIRYGAYIGKNSVVMPSFINIGAYVDSGSMIDTWATIGSCAQIGKNCHISGGAGIGGVLEPLQGMPVIIEDNCFIGARSEIVEGVIVEEGAVIGMGVFIGSSTKIVYRDTGEVIYGKVPKYSVVVSGSMPNQDPNKPSLSCAVIIKQVDEKTRSKTSVNELLR